MKYDILSNLKNNDSSHFSLFLFPLFRDYISQVTYTFPPSLGDLERRKNEIYFDESLIDIYLGEAN